MNASTSWNDIPRDHQEKERIRLEQQLFRNVSFDRTSFEFSLEFPRNPPDHTSFPDGISQQQAIPESGNETLSTAAHHASAITLRAGLRGRNRADSPSGAEYDPDRHLDALLRAGTNLSLLDEDPSKLSDAPPSSRSQFTKRAQGLSKQIDHEQHRASQPAKPRRAIPLHRIHQFPTRVQLPDVTGLTSAVASPFKGEHSHRAVTSNQGRTPLDPVNALETLTRRLRHIEKENATSRRRVTELEMELDTCKQDVVRERTRLHDLSRSQQQKSFSPSKQQRTVSSSSVQESERRYRQVVEEKKALEALVNSLRSHLARMSQQVQQHQELIDDLRSAREKDVQQLQAKCQEIDQLRAEVDSLTEEVERLREVVEAGLEERKRSNREQKTEETREMVVESDPDRSIDHPNDMLSAVIEEEEPLSTKGSADNLIPLRSNHLPKEVRPPLRRFIQDAELDRLRADLEERRSQRSSSEKSVSRSEICPPSPKRAEERQPQHRSHRRTLSHNRPTSPVRATSPTTLPQIRGERLEKLFHSAPEHNAGTCVTCHRRKRRSLEADVDLQWLNGHPRRRSDNKATRGQDDQDIALAEHMSSSTTLVKVLREIEEDFSHYKSVYIELADQYKVMDAVSNVAKRNLLANHLREVIDILEQKGDQIASLSDLIKDRPLSNIRL